MRRSILLAVVLLAAAVPAAAQGVLIPEMPRILPMPRPAPGPHPLRVKTLRVETRVRGQVATTRVFQTFASDLDFPVDGTYFYPLPEDATFVEFITWDGEKKLRGEVLEKDEARRRYLEIVRRSWDPGLLEYAGANLFQARIFPVPARGEKRVELAYSQILKADHGVVGYAYPLHSGTRANPQPIGNAAVSVEIDAPQGIKSIYSPSHSVEVRRDGDRRARASFEASNVTPDRNFQLFYSLSDAEFGLSLLTYRESGEDGYFMILLAPKVEALRDAVLAKDVVFVLDTSGSMQDRGKMEKARAALRFGVGQLHAGDRFNIVAFSSDARKFREALVEASPENREAALQFIARQAASGGTNISEGLLDGLSSFADRERPGYLVFVTDGLPTVGETDAGRIVRDVTARNRAGVRLFSFGVGYDVNTFLLDQLAARNAGAPDYVAPDEDLEVKLSNFFARVSSPVMTGLELDLSALSATDVYPRPLPDLFRGSQVTLLGRYSASGPAPIALRGAIRGERRTLRFDSNLLPASAVEHDFLPRLWAMRKVGFLLEEIRMNGESSELKNEVVRLAKKFGFVTPYTSYLAADESDFITRGRNTPPPMPLQMGASPAAGFGGGVRSEASQLQAVTASIALKDMKAAEVATERADRGARRVGKKLFREKDGAWLDADFDPSRKLPVIDLPFGSDALLSALAADPQLAAYASLGKNVTAVHKGKVYRIHS